jgi:FKBP-type peptidyl-prolyl cis-trans isomerase
MKNLKTYLKVLVFILFVAAFATGCMKDTNTVDPPVSYTPEREATMIKEWLDSMSARKISLDTTSTGILYIPVKIGSGATVKTGDVITVKYTGMFLDGTIFDASEYQNEAGTMSYVHKTNRMIQGWEEGVEVLQKGGKAIFLIPSAKGYGVTGSRDGTIPPYSPLIFMIEVVDIK